uniref:Trans-1,2-dihydrobenzene-1,2-diol dehydrogenase n=1 Tax=Corethrella appendiculata TaxID=1370023 RepID=U5EL44_9DIPT
MAPLRWGIVSAGLISHDFVNAVGIYPETEHKVLAIAARNQNSANEFAKLHGIPIAYEGYDKLAKDPNIDAVYIGVINPMHYDIGILMLDHGKHILCEKPLCMNEKQARKLLNYAKAKKLFIMEAIWSRFFPAYIELKEKINNGEFGEIKEVEVEFGFPLFSIDRVQKKNLGGGTILDLGVYTIQICQWVFGQEPASIKASGKVNDEGVDIYVEAELKYPNGGVGKMKTSGIEKLSNVAVVKGTKGTFTLHDFWCPIKITNIDGNIKTYEIGKGKLDFKYQNSAGLRFEAEEVRQCVNAGKLEPSSVSHNDSLIIAKIQDELRKQIGVKYPEDD